MQKTDASEQNINAFIHLFEEEVRDFKIKSVQQIIDAHPKFFHHVLEFDDWESGMKLLNKNKPELYAFLRGTND